MAIQRQHLRAEQIALIRGCTHHKQVVGEPAQANGHGVETVSADQAQYVGMAIVGQCHGTRRAHRQAGAIEFRRTRHQFVERGFKGGAGLIGEASLDLRQQPKIGQIPQILLGWRCGQRKIHSRIRFQRRIQNEGGGCHDEEQNRDQGNRDTLQPAPGGTNGTSHECLDVGESIRI